ncbi:MAG: hypothetical protein GF310_13190 [candidate division Zixibacteria bacterium]|nr:hypothetical protein [candidate division Zixibacteria bacterium]
MLNTLFDKYFVRNMRKKPNFLLFQSKYRQLFAYIMDMQSKKEYLYAEVLVDSELLEKFPEERSAYYQTRNERDKREFSRKFIAKLNWHIRNSLSDRQREVIELIIEGLTEREIAARLEIAQQVVNIYKWRAIMRLRKKIKA